MSQESFNFDKFVEDMELRENQKKKRQQELANAEDMTPNRRRDANNKEDWRNRVRWSR
jgi:hypothetical protein